MILLSEAEVIKDIRMILNLIGYKGYRIHQSLGSHKGIADIIGHTPNVGLFFAIEAKSQKRKSLPSDNQKKFLRGVAKDSGLAAVAHFPEDVLELFGLWAHFPNFNRLRWLEKRKALEWLPSLSPIYSKEWE